MKELAKNAIKALLLVVASVGLALPSQRLALVTLPADLLSFASTAVFAFAAMIRLGWRQASIDGNTRREVWDGRIFLALSCLGVYLASLVVL